MCFNVKKKLPQGAHMFNVIIVYQWPPESNTANV